MRMPPKDESKVLGPLVLTAVYLMSNPAPSRRIPPAVLLLTVTWSRRRMPPVAQMPGEPPVIDRPRI